MGKKDDKIEVTGTVIDVNSGNIKVKLDKSFSSQDHVINATICGKMRINKIRILQGDSVVVLISPYDLTRGIIIYRNK